MDKISSYSITKDSFTLITENGVKITAARSIFDLIFQKHGGKIENNVSVSFSNCKPCNKGKSSEENIEMLGQVIDSLRETSSDPSYKDYVIEWLGDPHMDSTDLEILIWQRNVLDMLQQARGILLQIDDGKNACKNCGHHNDHEDESDTHA